MTDYRKFLNDVATELDNDLAPKCDCPDASERKITSLVVMAYVNGEPEVFCLPEFADSEPTAAAVALAILPPA